jgi:hypothetical protein
MGVLDDVQLVRHGEGGALCRGPGWVVERGGGSIGGLCDVQVNWWVKGGAHLSARLMGVLDDVQLVRQGGSDGGGGAHGRVCDRVCV